MAVYDSRSICEAFLFIDQLALAEFSNTEHCNIFRGRYPNVKCMGFIVITSILFRENITLHRPFGIRVPLAPEPVSNIKTGTAKDTQLSEVQIFLINEALVLQKKGLNKID